MTNAWHDIFTDGRRLEKIIRFCETMIFKKDIDEQLKLSYIDRMIKATRQKVEIVKIELDVNYILGRDKPHHIDPTPPDRT